LTNNICYRSKVMFFGIEMPCEQYTVAYEDITPAIEKRIKQNLRWLFRTLSYVTWEKI
jgi:hypothetical protein